MRLSVAIGIQRCHQCSQAASLSLAEGSAANSALSFFVSRQSINCAAVCGVQPTVVDSMVHTSQLIWVSHNRRRSCSLAKIMQPVCEQLFLMSTTAAPSSALRNSVSSRCRRSAGATASLGSSIHPRSVFPLFLSGHRKAALHPR